MNESSVLYLVDARNLQRSILLHQNRAMRVISFRSVSIVTASPNINSMSILVGSVGSEKTYALELYS